MNSNTEVLDFKDKEIDRKKSRSKGRKVIMYTRTKVSIQLIYVTATISFK